MLSHACFFCRLPKDMPANREMQQDVLATRLPETRLGDLVRRLDRHDVVLLFLAKAKI